MDILFYSSLFLPLLLGLIYIFLHEEEIQRIFKINIIIYFLLTLLIVYFWIIGYQLHSQFFVVDNINIIYYSLIIILSFFISFYAYFYFNQEIKHLVIGLGRLKEYNIFINLFIFSMLLVSTTTNFIIMWIGIEATTIFTTFLISFYNTKTSWEAAWKYIIICGIGVTLGLFGLFLMIFAGIHTLNFTEITSQFISQATINTSLLKLSFLFVLIGFGTKAGFFPLNSWLPDAHGKGSSPISAFMSSILLPLAFYIIIRVKTIIDLILNNNFTNQYLFGIGLLSVIYGGFVLIKQNHFKRALAYSSSENMGIIAIAFSLGTPMANILGFGHIIGHSFIKAASFMSVGNILLYQDTGKFSKIGNLFKYMRISGILTILSIFMLVGLPPSPLFFTEIGIILEIFKYNIWFALLFIIGLILAFSGIITNFASLYLNNKNEKLKIIPLDNRLQLYHGPIIISLICAICSITYLLIYLLV